MEIINQRITLKTKGSGDLVNITDEISELLQKSKTRNDKRYARALRKARPLEPTLPSR
jgi:hypothetical protein